MDHINPEEIIHLTPPVPGPISHTDVHRRLALLEACLEGICDWINNHDTPKGALMTIPIRTFTDYTGDQLEVHPLGKGACALSISGVHLASVELTAEQVDSLVATLTGDATDAPVDEETS